MKIKLPAYATEILNLIKDNGYEAVIVGGAVRDALLEKDFKDIDFATNAKPTEIKRIFKDYPIINKNGEKHGTITIMYKNYQVEISTYRIQTNYKDHKYPTTVQYTDSLFDDLSCRDFTINAMAYDGKELIDYFNGQEDLQNKVIRTVNKAEDRFNEDALRILRGIRFASKLDFSIDPDTLEGMLSCITGLASISKERIQMELNQMVVGKNFANIMLNTKAKYILSYIVPELGPAINFDQNNRYHMHDLFTHIISVVNGLNDPAKDYRLYVAALLHDVGKYTCSQVDSRTGQYHFIGHAEQSYKMAKCILNNLKYSKVDTEIILWLIKNHDIQISIKNPKRSVKKLMSRLPIFLTEDEQLDLFTKLCQLRDADRADHQNLGEFVSSMGLISLYHEIIADQECFSLKQLAVSGKELLTLGFQGPAVGKTLNTLLAKVITGELVNNQALLLTAAKKMKVDK